MTRRAALGGPRERGGRERHSSLASPVIEKIHETTSSPMLPKWRRDRVPRHMKAEKTSSDFIREQPQTMSATEVVEKGKAAGFRFDASLVSKVRRRALSGASHRKTRKAAARPGVPSKPVQSKAQFVRKFPSSTPAKEIVAKAKAAGISIAVDHVYSVRSADKQAKRKSATKSNGLKPAEPVAPVVHGSASAPKVSVKAEMLLRAAAAEIGLGNAIAVLQSERARVQGLISG